MTGMLIGAGLWACAAAAGAQVISLGDDGRVRMLCTAWQIPRPVAAPQAGPPAAYAAMIARAAAAYDLAPDLLDTLARRESGYDPAARSAKGAIGLMQLTPATAKALGVDPRDPQQNILGGAALLRRLLDANDGRIDLALAGYNAGQGAVAKYGGVPPYAETREYVRQNLDQLAAISENAVREAEPEASQAPVNADNYVQTCPSDAKGR